MGKVVLKLISMFAEFLSVFFGIIKRVADEYDSELEKLEREKNEKQALDRRELMRVKRERFKREKEKQRNLERIAELREKYAKRHEPAKLESIVIPKTWTVYHIRTVGDYELDRGYIGVSSNVTVREKDHWLHLERGDHKNYKLQAAFNRTDLEFVILYSGLTEHEAYDLEKQYRPYANVGLNIAPGGKKGYAPRFAT
ncbi:hypothetical protein L1D41_26860 [Vibrio harveyi]|uniref:hypothetical protein n=1 Tax=Vibrio harveyi TaxID=669 RepID=UPI001EFCF419|nr:hypothetical protein [Vibrio harveyi]MCG9613252.1 hypothetical protein [Vibrio harveyi]MCG9671816.1 hypothetical protein [Vibrio harveyi]